MSTTETITPAEPVQPWGWLGDRDGGLPLREVAIEARVDGLFATTTVRQTFRNTRTGPIEATYVFPLPDRAAVTGCTADLAGRRVVAELRERAEARDGYDRAVAAGHRAGIAEEDRPGVFTLRIGNLAPGEDALVSLQLAGPVPVDAGVAE